MNMHAIVLMPAVSSYIVNIYLVGVGLFLILVALAISCYVLERLARAYDAACSRLEYKLHRRRVRLRSTLYRQRHHPHHPKPVAAPHPSPTAVNTATNRATVLPYKARRTTDSRDVLRRSGDQGDNRPIFPRGK